MANRRTAQKGGMTAVLAIRVLEALFYLIQVMKPLRVAFVHVSPLFFAWYYLEFDLWEHQEEWIDLFVRSKRQALLAPRAHGKSETLASVLVLWKIVINRNIRILIVTRAIDLARKHVVAARYQLQHNERIIADFGRFYDRNNIWTQTEIKVIRSMKKKDATIEAVGMLGSVTGSRFDLIIFDDIIDTRDTNTPDLIEKVKDYVDGTLLPLLEPWGFAWVIGTRKHFDDIYSSIIHNSMWRHRIYRAIIRYPEKYMIVELDTPVTEIDEMGNVFQRFHDVIIQGDQGEVLCPERWSMRALLMLKHTIGSAVFEREYQNNVVDDATALFKRSDLEACRDENRSYMIGPLSDEQRSRYVAIIQGIDPSLIDDEKKAKLKKSDFMVIWTVGLTQNGKRELLGLFRKRGLSPAQVEAKIVKEYERFMPTACFIEVNSFGLIHWRNAVDRKGYNFIKHQTTGAKNDLYRGVPMLSVVYENGLISLPYRTEEDKKLTDRLIQEFNGLGSDPHDDIVMAAWIAETGVRRYLKGQAHLQANRERR